MYRSEVIPPANDILKAIQSGYAKAPTLMANNLNRRTFPIRNKALDMLRTEPPRPAYPLRWKSERQRRFIFASNAGGRGLGAPRTHELSQGWAWRYRVTEDTYYLELVNPTPYARFVQGEDQQPFHQDTGWATTLDALAGFASAIEDATITAWVETHDQLLARGRV